MPLFTTTKGGPNDRVNFTEGVFVAGGVNPDGSIQTISEASAVLPGFAIPAYDYIALTYFGSTNNVETAVYKTGGSGGTVVATLTLAYAGGGAANDDLVTSVTKS